MSKTDPEAQTDAVRAARAILKGLHTIERERRRIRSEDWKTLFRQLSTTLTELAQHPFVIGDTQAEMLISRLIKSNDLEELDKCVDDFADYAVNKLRYNAQLKAVREGKDPLDVPLITAPPSSQSHVTRVQATQGPSGADFALVGETEQEADLADRRSVFRL